MSNLENKKTHQNDTSPKNEARDRLYNSIKHDKRVLNVFIFLGTVAASWGFLGINDGPLANKVTEEEKNEFYKSAFMKEIQRKVEAQPQDAQQSALTHAESYLSGNTSVQSTDNGISLVLDFEKISRDANKKAKEREEAAKADNHGQSMGRIFLGAMFAVGALGKNKIIRSKIDLFEQRYGVPKP